jgi:uncharacterized protein (TIGR01777 family)
MGESVRVGVTGASGLIGTSLVAALRERNDSVVTFVRPTSRITHDNVVRWDPSRGLLDDDDLRRAGGFDALVNLAGAGIGDRRWNAKRKSEIMASRVSATSLLCDVATSSMSGVSFLANASAVGWYGSRGDEPLDESSTRGEGFLANVCDAWENAALALRATGTTVARLRSGVVLSLRGGALRQQLPLFRTGVGGRLGSGRQWLSPISLYDEVAAILWVLDHRLEGPVNLVAPTPLTNRSFTRDLATALHRPGVFAVPAAALRITLGVEMADELVLASQRVTPQSLLASGYSFAHPDAAAALTWALAAT